MTASVGCTTSPPVLPASVASAAPNAALIPVLSQLATALGALVSALQGQQALGIPVPLPAPLAGSSTSSDPLSGFTGNWDAGERATLGTALTQIGSTSVGATLLGQVRGRGITLEIVDDATFLQASGGGSVTAAAVYMNEGGKNERVLLRASSLTKSPTAAVHALAHELTHAAQQIPDEGVAQYRQGIGAAAAGMSEDQLKTGATLMSEAGAEAVASAIDAQLKDPAGFAAKARGNIAYANQQMWRLVDTAGYNPQRYSLPQFVSPTATGLVNSALGA